jgi:hypothetical protein
MGDAREPGDAVPLARVHHLRARATRGASGGTPGNNAGVRVPSLRVRRGRVVELDGRAVADFDAADAFVAQHGLDLTVATEAMAMDAVTFGRMLVHPAAPAQDMARLAVGMTPAQLTAALVNLRVGELSIAAAKLRTVRDGRGDRPSGGEVLVMGPVEPEVETEQGRAAARETPWSTALTVSSYAARGLRSRIVTGGTRSGASGHEAVGHAVRRVVLARAMGAWGVALTRTDEADPRAAVEEVVALLLGLDARPPTAGIGSGRADGDATGDFGADATGLRRRAAVLARAGRPQVAESLRRAAELLAFGDDEMDRLCASLRPTAASVEVLQAESIDLQARGAKSCGEFLREAATVYAALGLGLPASP